MTDTTIQNKVVFITGGSSGIGEATAHLLASRGAKVVIAARRVDKLNTIASAIKAKGGDVLAVEMDVTKRQQVEDAVKKAIDHFGKLDVMMNNAGYMAIAPMEKLHVEDWDKMIDINIKGVLNGIATALPIFQKQKKGQFINLSSVAGIKIFAPGGTVYGSTKYAVRAISDGLRQEVGKDIRVTTMEPGAISTAMNAGDEKTLAMSIPADAIARGIAFAIEQPANVDVNELTVRPTAQDF